MMKSKSLWKQPEFIIFQFLHIYRKKDFFVSVINPYLMKSYRNESLRKVKTDKIDSRIIANYGIDHWFKMKEFQTSGEIYEELKLLGQQYRHYMKLHLFISC